MRIARMIAAVAIAVLAMFTAQSTLVATADVASWPYNKVETSQK